MSIKKYKCERCGRGLIIPSKFKGENLCALCFQKAKQADRDKLPEKQGKVTETKVTCRACGNVWYYGMQDKMQNFSDSSANCSKSLFCCSGCFPALFIPDKKVEDFDKCQKCGSRATKKETITHNV